MVMCNGTGKFDSGSTSLYVYSNKPSRLTFAAIPTKESA
jgi:hypothetical protein